MKFDIYTRSYGVELGWRPYPGRIEADSAAEAARRVNLEAALQVIPPHRNGADYTYILGGTVEVKVLEILDPDKPKLIPPKTKPCEGKCGAEVPVASDSHFCLSCRYRVATFETHTTLVISTAHIRECDSALLDSDEQDTFAIYDTGYGWRVFVGWHEDDNDSSIASAARAGYSEEFQHLVKEARRWKCKYLEIDCDGPEVKGIPEFNW